jgi:hypothetical protein
MRHSSHISMTVPLYKYYFPRELAFSRVCAIHIAFRSKSKVCQCKDFFFGNFFFVLFKTFTFYELLWQLHTMWR